MMTATESTTEMRCNRELYWLGVVIVLATVMYATTFRYLWDKWMTDTQYSLAFLVPLVSGYFVKKQWQHALSAKRASSKWGLVLIALALVMHLMGVVLDVSGPSSFSVLVFIIGSMLYFHGPNLLRALWFPTAYLFFMIPIPGGILDLIGFPLQLWASGASETLLHVVGISDIYRSGVNMRVGDFDFQVAEACSGLSSLVALIGVTAVFAYITRLPNAYKWLLFALAVPIALAANVVRVTTIALVAVQWGEDAAMNAYHDYSSPVLFVAEICLLFLISWGLEWLSGRRTTS